MPNYIQYYSIAGDLGFMAKAKTKDDHERLPSGALDDVVGACNSFRPHCKKPFEATVERRERSVSDTEEGNPLHYEVKLLYILRDPDNPEHPVMREETVARLLYDHRSTEELPVLRTTSEGLNSEIQCQIAARLAKLGSLKGVKSVTYYPNPDSHFEATEKKLGEMTAGKEIPKEVYVIVDKLEP